MKKDVLNKIQRVYKFWLKTKTRKGVTRTGPYWMGCYREGGKDKTAYIGKELPADLVRLLEGRITRPGYKNTAWPGQRA